MAGLGWDGTTRVQRSLVADWLKIDDQTAVPREVIHEAEGSNGHPDFTMRFEVRDGRPECVDIHLRAKPKGRALTEADLTRLKMDQIAVAAFALMAVKYERTATGVVLTGQGPDSGELVHQWAERELYERQKRVRRPVSALELEQVATVYREHLDDRPTSAVQRELGYTSQRTAARRVQQARDAGLLPPTTPGKKQA